MDKYHSFKIGNVEAVEMISTYQRETVEHLVDQLIKLQNEFDQREGSKVAEIHAAMKKINKALDMALLIEGE